MRAAAVVAIVLASLGCRPALDAEGNPITVGRFRLRTFPPGAKVWIDGELKVITTPATLILPEGKYTLRMQLDGAEPYERTIEIEAGGSKDFTFNIPKPPDATITVHCDVPGAKVRINGYTRGRTPLEKAITLPGPIDITVTTADGRARSISGSLARSEQKVLQVRFTESATVTSDEPVPLPPAPGWVTIGTRPEGEILDVARNVLGTTPLRRFALPAGRHVLILRSENDNGPLERRVTVEVTAGKHSTYRFRLWETDSAEQ